MVVDTDVDLGYRFCPVFIFVFDLGFSAYPGNMASFFRDDRDAVCDGVFRDSAAGNSRRRRDAETTIGFVRATQG